MFTTDEEIATGLKKGNHKAFEILYDKYFNKMVIYSYKIVNDQAIAEEIVQDIIFNIWEKREKLSFSPQLQFYLFRSVHNNSLRHIQRTKRFENENTILDHIPTDIPCNIEVKELEIKIRNAVDRLPQQTKEIFKYSREEELSYKEIAQKTKLSVKSIEYHMSKAIKTLHFDLKDILIILFAIINFGFPLGYLTIFVLYKYTAV